jgi:hemolysin activation/secretion protein
MVAMSRRSALFRLHGLFHPGCVARLLPILLLACCAIQRGQAQTPDGEVQRRRSQAEAQERLERQQAPGVRLQEAAPAALPDDAPLPADAHCFPIRRIMLAVPERLPPAMQRAGASVLPQDPFHGALTYLQRYENQCMGPNAIRELGRRVSRRILAQGYSLTRVSVPEQDLAGQTLTFALIPGVIRAFRFPEPGGVNWRSAFPARPGDLLNLRDLEQGLEQMKRLASQDVALEIVPGESLGEGDVLIRMKRGKPWRVIASADDSGARGTGKLQAGLNMALDNALGLNDLLTAGASTDAERDGASRGTGGAHLAYALPYGYWNLALSASRYRYHQQVAGYNETFMSSGRSRELELKAQRLFQRDQSQKNSLQFRLVKRWNAAFIDDTEIVVQRRSTTMAELAWLHRHYAGQTQLDLTLAGRWGVSWLNGQADEPGREPGAPVFRYSLQTLDATLATPFSLAGQRLVHSAALHAQTTRSALYLVDKFSIGSRYTVRGFDGETMLASERGFFVRNDIELLLGSSGQSLYAGLDYGQLFGPSARQLTGSRLAGAAAGMRGSAYGLAYDLFSGWALHKPAGLATRNPVFGFNLSYQF